MSKIGLKQVYADNIDDKVISGLLEFIDVVNKHTNLKVATEYTDGNIQLNISKCQVVGLTFIYKYCFGQRTNGCFVEVGAFDGEYLSNTNNLADIGWIGYYIEPVPEYFERCKARHAKNKNITVSQLAIGAETRTVEVNIGGPLSTIRDKVKQIYEFCDWSKHCFDQKEGKVQVEQRTLNDYLIEHGIKPDFELLVVDVEGYEWEVFRNFDIAKWQPQMAIVEIRDKDEEFIPIREDYKKVIRYFNDNDYKEIYKDSTNTIYLCGKLIE